jgi:hypothetical protein
VPNKGSLLMKLDPGGRALRRRSIAPAKSDTNSVTAQSSGSDAGRSHHPPKSETAKHHYEFYWACIVSMFWKCQGAPIHQSGCA